MHSGLHYLADREFWLLRIHKVALCSHVALFGAVTKLGIIRNSGKLLDD